MPDQVNAWASYEQTGKTARRFSSRDRPQGKRGSIATTPIGFLSEDFPSSPGADWNHNRRTSLTRGSSGAFERRSSQQDVLNRSKHGSGALRVGEVQLSSLVGGGTGTNTLEEETGGTAGTATVANHRRQGYFERLSSKRGVSTQKLTSASFEKDKLTKGLRNDISDVFAVFFEATHSGSEASFEMEDTSFSLSYFMNTLNATMPWTHTYFQSNIIIFIEICLRGISQVYFQDNPISGLFILIGMFLQSTRIAIHGVIAIICGNGTAFLLGFDQGLVLSGLFGYNSFLVGLALATFDSQANGDRGSDYHASTLMATIVLSMFSSILFVMMGKLLVPYKSPPLTLPFNIATLIFLLGMSNMGRVSMDSVRDPALPTYGGEMEEIAAVTVRQFFGGIIRGIGQVYLANNLTSGILVLVGITICSRIAAIAAVVGSALGAVGAVWTGAPGSVIENGMYGFNASLAFTAMFFFYAPSKGAAVFGIFASIMAVGCQQALATLLEPWGLPFMTLPFCVATLPFVILQGTTSIVIAIPLATMTIPEDHYRRVRMLTDGVSFMLDSISLAVKQKDEHGSDGEGGGGGSFRLSSQILKSKRFSRQMSKSLNLLSDAIADHDVLDEDNMEYNTCWGRPCAGGGRGGGGGGMQIMEESILSKVTCKIFNVLDDTNTGHLPLEVVTSALQACGLIDPEGLHFASLILTLLDLDESGTIEIGEFVAFAMVARAVRQIRKKISKFFDFVDENGNGLVDFHEIDMALDYLGQPTLKDEDKENLARVISSMTNNTNDEGNIDAVVDVDAHEIDIVELINFVTVSKVEEFVKQYHEHEKQCQKGRDSTAKVNSESGNSVVIHV